MYRIYTIVRVALLAALISTLSGCNDPHIYGSIGISSGSGGGYHHGGWNSGISTSISVGGRIH